MQDKPIKFTEHSVIRMLNLNLTEDDVLKVIKEGNRIMEGKVKNRFVAKTKKSTIVVICAEYPDRIQVMTINKGGKN